MSTKIKSRKVSVTQNGTSQSFQATDFDHKDGVVTLKNGTQAVGVFFQPTSVVFEDEPEQEETK